MVTRSASRQRLLPVFSSLIVILAVVVFTGAVIIPVLRDSSDDASPDEGRGRIAFLSDRDGNNEIYVMNEDGSQQTRLTTSDVFEESPMWSPDGQRIAFSAAADGAAASELFVMSADGSNLLRLTTNELQERTPAWSPDSTALAYFAYYLDGPVELRLAETDGSGETLLVPGAVHGYSFPSWSPDGRHLAFIIQNEDGGDVAIVDRDGGALSTIPTSDLQEKEVTWSPGEDRLAMVAQAGDSIDIFTMAVDGSNLTRLTQTPDEEFSLTWSPDGSKLAFFQPGQGGELFVVNADGSNLMHVAGRTSESPFVTWSPDSSRVAFSGYAEGDTSPGIYAVRADGTGLSRLLSSESSRNWWPVWRSGRLEPSELTPTAEDQAPTEVPVSTASPTLLYTPLPTGEGTPPATEEITSTPLATTQPPGHDTPTPLPTSEPAVGVPRGQIAFISGQNVPGTLSNEELMIVDAGGGSPTRLAEQVAHLSPVWSPDGKRVAFVSNGIFPDNAYDLYVVDLDGGNLLRLTQNPELDYHPAWSPDGSYIVFESRRSNQIDLDLYVVGLDGSGLSQLTRGEAFDSEAVWSPDGTQIAFIRYYGNSTADLYVTGADGSDVRPVTQTTGYTGSPVWSPDGKRLAFVSVNNIYTINADGSDLTQVTHNTPNGNSYLPAWSPDGQTIAYLSGVVNQNQSMATTDLHLANADGSNQRLLAENVAYDFAPAWSPDSRWIACSVLVEGQWDIFAVNILNGGLQYITNDSIENWGPAWQPIVQLAE